MKKKLVSVQNYQPIAGQVTKSHILLVTAYIWTLGLEVALSDLKSNSIKGDGLFVKEFKNKTNHFFEYITRKVRMTFGQMLDIDEKALEDLYVKAVERAKFQNEEFLKDLINLK